MANSKYEYVKSFEPSDRLLPNTWIVVRIDGRGFHKLSSVYEFSKPNDRRALGLMNEAAKGVMESMQDLVIGYGVSDEFSFVFHKSCELFERRASKLLTTVVSTFSAHYIHLWPSFFPSTPLLLAHLPTFDGRVVPYPSIQNLRDYLSWRQADCHINNLYNTTFWTLVQRGGMTARQAEEALKGTLAKDKNEILFARFGVNYNNEMDIFRKGSVVFREYDENNVSRHHHLPDTSSPDSDSDSDRLDGNQDRDGRKDRSSDGIDGIDGRQREEQREEQLVKDGSNGREDNAGSGTEDDTAVTADVPEHLKSSSPPLLSPSRSETQGRQENEEGTQRKKAKARSKLKSKAKAKATAKIVVVRHVDIIRDGFWESRPWILGD